MGQYQTQSNRNIAYRTFLRILRVLILFMYSLSSALKLSNTFSAYNLKIIRQWNESRKSFDDITTGTFVIRNRIIVRYLSRPRVS